MPSSTITNLGTDTIETKYYYPPFSSMSTQPNVSSLITNFIIGSSLSKETFRNGIKVSEERTLYGTNLFPESIYAAKFPNDFPNIPSVGNLERKVTFNSYDSKGNVTQYTLQNGAPVSIIWGFNKTKVVAKLENIAYNLIPANLLSDIENITNNPTSGQNSINNALEALRTSSDSNLQGAFITTINYDSFRGISVITDPKGNKTIYDYDNNNRLEFVRDNDNRILTENKYHYKN